jgi:Helix-turn-helix domain
MSNSLLTAAWRARCDTDGEKLVLLRLADMANDRGACWPSVAKLASDCGISERSVPRAITANQEHGHITVKPVPGRTNQYTVHPRQAVTPDTVSPLTGCPKTPDTVSPKPSGTHIREKDKPTAGKGGLKAMFQEALEKELNREH